MNSINQIRLTKMALIWVSKMISKRFASVIWSRQTEKNSIDPTKRNFSKRKNAFIRDTEIKMDHLSRSLKIISSN